jgi:hypothetical protein
MLRRPDHSLAIGSRDAAPSLRSRRSIRPALSPAGLPWQGSQYPDERCVEGQGLARAPEIPSVHGQCRDVR